MLHICKENYSDSLKENEKLIINCTAEWCGFCKGLKPNYEQLAKDYMGRIVFSTADVDKNNYLHIEFDLQSVPTLLFFIKGKMISKYDKQVDPLLIKEWIDETLSKY